MHVQNKNTWILTDKRGFLYTYYVATATQNLKVLYSNIMDILSSQHKMMILDDFWPDKIALTLSARGSTLDVRI